MNIGRYTFQGTISAPAIARGHHPTAFTETDNFPRNEWETVTYLRSTSTAHVSSITLNITLNLQVSAGLDNYDIDTAGLICMWTSRSLGQISKACMQLKARHGVKSVFHTARTSSNLWSTDSLVLQARAPSTNLERLRYTGKLEPVVIAARLYEVGLNPQGVCSRFRQYFLRAFHTDARCNPCQQYTVLNLPEIYPGPTDDTLLDEHE
jgi:hypothetical protein